MKDEGFFIKYYEHDKQSIHIFTHKYLILVDQIITMGLKYPDNNRRCTLSLCINIGRFKTIQKIQNLNKSIVSLKISKI